ncbi:hypothetical protein [Zobellia galactanivorans]|nr:hypothetical protein [Zobellia galactanivorans]MBU3024827.1 hypothetical protein [Zobellia galactanivorans]
MDGATCAAKKHNMAGPFTVWLRQVVWNTACVTNVTEMIGKYAYIYHIP